MRGLGRSLRIACSLCLLASAACKLPGTTAVDTAAAYTPTWISASWDAGSPAQNLSVELFYCGDQSTMMFGPLRCAP